jgi:hypothetical protein
VSTRTTLSAWQRAAIENWTLIPEEQMRPLFQHVTRLGTFCLTVKAGWG